MAESRIVAWLSPDRSSWKITSTSPLRRLKKTSVTLGPTVSMTSGPWVALGRTVVGAAVTVLPNWSTAIAVMV